MKINPPKNQNYCAIVTALNHFVDLANCDNVKAAVIFGNSVIVSKAVEPGAVGLFFPVETALAPEFLAANNLFRKPEWGNADKEKKGFFEQHGRVKAVKFRGHKSEGFWIPLDSLAYLNVPLDELTPGTEFDEIDGHAVCWKYVPRFTGHGPAASRGRKAESKEDKILLGQFRFHSETANLRRNIHRLQPTDWISVSDKWHGTSAVYSNVLVRRSLNWVERLLRRFGVPIQESQYGFIWSSRKVIKGIDQEVKHGNHFYGTDVWGETAKQIRDVLPKGYTVYGEIVGYTAEGRAIQSLKGQPYSYGCQPGTNRLLVYRVTTTNPDGTVLELGWLQMKQFCAKYGLEMVRELYFGQAEGLCPVGDSPIEEWQGRFLKAVESRWVTDGMCPHNENRVPAEGVVIKIERLDEADSYKCKNFRFLESESAQLDTGEQDMETRESEESPVGGVA